MVNKPFSELDTVAFKGSLLVPAVDTTLPIEDQNVNLLASSFPAGTGGGASTIDDLTDAAALTGTPYSFVGFDKSSQPAVILSSVANTIIGFDATGVPAAANRLAVLNLLGLMNATMTCNLVGPVVNNVTIFLSPSMPEGFVINSMDVNLFSSTGSGSFTATIAINGTTVTGLGSVVVSHGAAVTRVNATALNTAAKGAAVTAAITATSGTPINGLISLNLTRN